MCDPGFQCDFTGPPRPTGYQQELSFHSLLPHQGLSHTSFVTLDATGAFTTRETETFSQVGAERAQDG